MPMVWTEERREAARRRATGRVFSAEAKAKMRAAKLGKKMGDAFKEKCRIASTGRRHSEEVKKRISEMKSGPRNHFWGKPSSKRKWTLSAEELRRCFVEEKMFMKDIADAQGVSVGTVVFWLRRFGIRLESRGGRQVGERGSSYKGGIKISRGYRFLAVAEDSPHRRDRDGYVAEHRIVASEMIGRVLSKDEEVHHLNFDKLDNAPSNLLIFGSGADHTRFHKYLERAGARLLGLAGQMPTELALDKPAFFRGAWVTVIELGN